VPVKQPRVNDKRIDPVTGERIRFSSAILPAWCRKSPRVSEVLPLLYLRGLSTSDFAPALEQFLGTGHGLSAATITRPTEQWRPDATKFGRRSLKDVDYVYLWVDGIHLKVRLEQDKVCLLVMIGVRADGRKERVALADGFRESAESWADLLHDCERRDMRAPVLAVGDGALGFWKALRDVFPETAERRCWWHKIGNVLAALPKSADPGAKRARA
jgi:putative transposase